MHNITHLDHILNTEGSQNKNASILQKYLINTLVSQAKYLKHFSSVALSVILFVWQFGFFFTSNKNVQCKSTILAMYLPLRQKPLLRHNIRL